MLKAGIVTGQESLLISMAADPLAKAYALRIITDALAEVLHTVQESRNTLQRNQNPTPGSDPTACSSTFLTDAILSTKDYIAKLEDLRKKLLKSASQQDTEVEKVYAFGNLVEKFEADSRHRMAQIVGDPLRGVKR